MRRWIAVSLLALSTSVVAPSSSLSFAQQDESVSQRKTLTKVPPAYPDLARKMNIQGVVKLKAVIAPDGTVKSTETVGGNPLLVQAAVEAVRKWRYEAGSQQTKELIELRFDTPRALRQSEANSSK
jgi:TonB family protein